MPRNRSRKKVFLNKKILTLGFLFTLILIFLITAQFILFVNSSKKTKIDYISPQNLKSVKSNASSSASPTLLIKQPTSTPKQATKSAVAIPYQFGRSVRVPILTYHYIGNNPNPADKARDSLSVVPDLFENQMKYLSENGYNSISLDTLYAALKGGGLPNKPVILTFDDGYIDFYYNAYPILRRFNLKATSFIPTGLMGGKMYMSWDMIKEISSSGLISFQAHSIHHYNLPSLSLHQAKEEIVESKKTLELMLGTRVNFFAYPYGTSKESIWKLVKDAGYLGAVGTWGSTTISEGVIFDMPRVRIPGGLSVSDFAKRL